MKKTMQDFVVVENRHIHKLYSLLRLRPKDNNPLLKSMPGQFVQISIDNSKSTFLRRPISINRIDKSANELWLLVRKAGDGTNALSCSSEGDVINIILPLGNGFSKPENKKAKILLIGGGVGVAPLLYFGEELKEEGYTPEFLLGARSENDLLEVDLFESIGNVHLSTDDGSIGECGVVTQHSVLKQKWDIIYCCGPAPMMKAVAKSANEINAECEVSLENMMACGLGACLCCVEKTVKGNVCVCTEGPVFNTKELTW